MEEAKQHREALMKERKPKIEHNTKNVYEDSYSFCEH